MTVLGHFQFFPDRPQLFGGDEMPSPRDLLDAGNVEALSFLNSRDELGGLQHSFRRAGVQPGKAPLQQFDFDDIAFRLLVP